MGVGLEADVTTELLAQNHLQALRRVELELLDTLHPLQIVEAVIQFVDLGRKVTDSSVVAVLSIDVKLPEQFISGVIGLLQFAARTSGFHEIEFSVRGRLCLPNGVGCDAIGCGSSLICTHCAKRRSEGQLRLRLLCTIDGTSGVRFLNRQYDRTVRTLDGYRRSNGRALHSGRAGGSSSHGCRNRGLSCSLHTLDLGTGLGRGKDTLLQNLVERPRLTHHPGEVRSIYLRRNLWIPNTYPTTATAFKRGCTSSCIVSSLHELNVRDVHGRFTDLLASGTKLERQRRTGGDRRQRRSCCHGSRRQRWDRTTNSYTGTIGLTRRYPEARGGCTHSAGKITSQCGATRSGRSSGSRSSSTLTLGLLTILSCPRHLLVAHLHCLSGFCHALTADALVDAGCYTLTVGFSHVSTGSTDATKDALAKCLYHGGPLSAYVAVHLADTASQVTGVIAAPLVQVFVNLHV